MAGQRRKQQRSNPHVPWAWHMPSRFPCRNAGSRERLGLSQAENLFRSLQLQPALGELEQEAPACSCNARPEC